MNFIDKEKFVFIKDIIQIVLLLIIIILLSISMFSKKENVVSNPDKNIALVSEEVVKEEVKCEKEENKEIRVDVKGAVSKQGVYLLHEGDIVNDAILAAGGITSKGTTKNINLSKKLDDQMVIYVYTVAELNKYMKDNEVDTKTNVEKESCHCPTYDISNCEGASIIENNEIIGGQESDNSNDENNIGGKININTASKEQLLSLSGIGESKALAIIEYRNNNGNFSSIEQIKNVTGIGDALFAKIKDFITI